MRRSPPFGKRAAKKNSWAFSKFRLKENKEEEAYEAEMMERRSLHACGD